MCGPWFRAVAAPAAAVAGFGEWPSVEELDRVLAPWLRAAGVRLVAAAVPMARAGEEVYELRIADDGEVPTRAASWHDLLNALQWAAFPRAKRALTARLAGFQRERVAARDAAGGRWPGRRDPEHDRLALVDEGGLIVLHAAAAAPPTPETLTAAVVAGDARAFVFGHALLEHALSGERTVRAAPIVLAVDGRPGDVAAADRALAAAFDAGADAWRPRSPGWAIDERWLVYDPPT